MFSAASAAELRRWVVAGGRLIAECCHGYFRDRGHVDPCRPRVVVDEVFGARQAFFEYIFDLLDELTVGAAKVPSGLPLQAYVPTTRTPIGDYADGQRGCE